MKRPKDGDRVNLARKLEVVDSSSDTEKWQPTEGKNYTHPYGKGTPTPSPTIEEMAKIDVRQYYPYLLEGSSEFERRTKEYLEKYS